MSDHSKTKFQDSWLNTQDKNGQYLYSWCRAGKNPYEAFCFIYNKTVACDNSGLYQVAQHATGKKHVFKCGSFLSSSQSKFSWEPSKKSQTVLQAVVDNTANKKSTTVLLSKTDCTTKAEALWAMKIAQCNYSFASCDSVGEVFREMFPDSGVAKEFSMGSRKVSYVISHGLEPYFTKELVNCVKNTYYTLHFDETTTSQVRKQMDMLVRFWCETTSRIQVRFLKALMFGHAFASTVSDRFIETFKQLSLPLDFLLSLSCDGPNVNKSIKNKMDSAVKEAGAKGLVDVGFCTIHVVHNAFRKGLALFGMNAEEFCIDIFYYFKLSSSRREDYMAIQQSLGLEEEMFIRHVQSRWLSLLPALDRVASQLAGLKSYFLKMDPSKDSSNRFQRIYKMLKNSNHVDELEVQLLFLQNVKPLFDSFLCTFQSEGPLIHCLYATLVDLIKTVLLRCIKQDVLKGKSGRMLLDLEVKNVGNYVELKDVEVGVLLEKKLKNMNEGVAKKHRLAARSFYIAVAAYLINSLPLSNRLLEALSCLHPELRQSAKGVQHIKLIAEKMPCVEDKDISAVGDEWKLYMLEDIPLSWYQEEITQGKKLVKKLKRNDDYWALVFALKTSSGEPKYPLLSRVVKCAMTLSHGNADTERSLSVNKRMLTAEKTSLSEESINAMRVVKDAVSHSGGEPFKVNITREMLSSCRAAHGVYSARIEEERQMKEQARKDKEKAEAERRMQEQKEKEYSERLKSLGAKNAQLKQDEVEAQAAFASANKLLNETQARLEKAIKAKNLNDVVLASDLLGVAKNRLEKAQTDQKNVNDKKRKIMASLESAAKVRKLT